MFLKAVKWVTVLVALLSTLPMFVQRCRAEGQILYFSFEVTDKAGAPVPNTQITFTPLTENGETYGPDSTGSGSRSNRDGLGEFGFGSAISPKPGALRITAEHPSIRQAATTVEWARV